MNHARSVESQAQQVVSAVQSEASATVQETQARAREVVNLAHAHEMIHQMHLKHQAEVAELQAIANDAHQAAQQRIDQLLGQLSHQNQLLEEQRREQRELRSAIKGLQEEVTNLRRSSEIQQQSQNGAGINVAELMSTIHELKRDLKEAINPSSPVAVKIACSNCITACSHSHIWSK